MAMEQMFGGDLGGLDLMSILDLLRQLYAARQSQQGLAGAADSGVQQGGGARQLPTQPVGGGNPTYGMPTGWQQSQGIPAGWGSVPGGAGAMSDPAGNTYDAAGNPLTFTGITTPQTSMPTDRAALIQSLARSSQPDRYGNVPYNGSTPGTARITAIPDFSKPPQPGNMVDPRNWDPTQWVNHPEWHNEEVWRAYQQSQGAYNNRGPYTDPSGGSTLPYQKQPLPPASSWGYDPATKMWGYQGVAAPNLSQPGQYQNVWSSLGFHNRADWKQAGRPQTLPQGTPLYSGVGGPYRGGTTPVTGGSMSIGLPSVGGGPAWQTGGYATKYDWKQAGRPGL